MGGGGPFRSFILLSAALLAATPSVIEFRLFRVARSGNGAKDTRVEDDTDGDAGAIAGCSESRDRDDDVEMFDAGLGRWRIPPAEFVGGAGQNLVFAGGSEASGGGLKCSRRDIVSIGLSWAESRGEAMGYIWPRKEWLLRAGLCTSKLSLKNSQ